MGLLILIGCSTPVKKSEDEESLELTSELNDLTKKVQVVNYGPSLMQEGNFIDKTKEYGLENLTAVAFNAIDLNFDGVSDLVVLPTYYSRPKFFLFDTKSNKFSAWAHDPLPVDFKASYLIFSDINKDKVMDVLVGVLNQRTEISQIPIKLYLGEVRKGLITFTEDKSAITLPAEPTSSLTLIDFDLDGWNDIFISNWFENRAGEHLPVADRLMRNNKGKFEEVTPLLRGEADKNSNQIYPPNAKPTYGAATCDVDQNGWPDILTASSSGHKNKMWMNLRESRTGERYFQDFGPVSNYASDPDGSLVPTGGGRTFFSSCTDYNDDGLMDAFLGELSHAYDNESVDKSSILTGSKESFPPFFLRTEYVSDVTSEAWNQGDRRAVWTDYNMDGRVDLLVDNSGFPPYSRLVLFEQDENRAFFNVASQSGIDFVNPTGSIVMDFNRDGAPDIISAQNSVRRADIPPRVYAFENQLKPQGQVVKVYLNGIKSNTDGNGAMVMLYSRRGKEKIVQRRWNETSQGGLPSQNAPGVHFAVPAGTDALGVKVRWPYLKRKGFGSGGVIEKLYSLDAFGAKKLIEVTVCEDGKILAGKISCQF